MSPKLLDMDRAQKNFKKILKTPTPISDTESEAFILLEYLEATEVTAKLRTIFRDIYFKKKIPNPLPKIVHKIEKYSIMQSSNFLSIEEIQKIFFFDEEYISQIYLSGAPLHNYHQAQTDTILHNNMNPIIAPQSLLKICPVENLSVLSTFMERLNWKLSNQTLIKYCEYFAVMSFSADAVFYNPLIYDCDNTILTIYYDFFLDEHDKTYGNFFFLRKKIICQPGWVLSQFFGLPYLMSFFRNALLENFQKLHFGLGFPEFLNPKKIPKICRKNWAIFEKLRDSANSKPKFYYFQKSKSLFPKNLTI